MAKRNEGHLSRYVRHIMKQKGLTQRDIESRSGGEMTDGYVSNILSGAARNPSALKMKALARGLGVDPHMLFDVICGPFEQPAARQSGEDRLDVVLVLEMMQEVAQSPELMKLVQEAVELEPEDRAAVLESIESLNQRKRKAQRRKEPPRRSKR